MEIETFTESEKAWVEIKEYFSTLIKEMEDEAQ